MWETHPHLLLPHTPVVDESVAQYTGGEALVSGGGEYKLLTYLGDVPQVFCALGTGSLAPSSSVTPLVSPQQGGINNLPRDLLGR